MEAVTIDGQKFVKASKVARDYGYTSDYIGQLCRNQKVTAQLVGRSWYVDIDSLEAHRANRYQKTSGSEKVSVTQTVQAVTTDSESNPVAITNASKKTARTAEPKAKSFYSRVPEPTRVPNYSADESDLFPKVRKDSSVEHKTGSIKINLADASSVGVTSRSDRYDFATPKRPKIAFKGSLAVEEIPEDTPLEMPPEPKPKPLVEPEPETTVKTPKKLPQSSLKRPQKPASSKQTVTRTRTVGVLTMQRKQVVNRNQTSDTVAVAQPAAEGEPAVPANRFVLVVTTATALLIVMAVLGFESTVTYSEVGIEERITFAIDRLIAAVYGSK